jgi:hypothetical protein
LLHHLEGLQHHLAGVELSLRRDGTGQHGKRNSIDMIPVQLPSIFNPKDVSAVYFSTNCQDGQLHSDAGSPCRLEFSSPPRQPGCSHAFMEKFGTTRL